MPWSKQPASLETALQPGFFDAVEQEVCFSLLSKVIRVGTLILSRALVVVISVSISLLLVEGVLRLVVPPLPITNTPTEVLDPRKLGFKRYATWRIKEPEFDQFVRINGVGYRDYEIDLKKPTVVFLGDSQTFGTGVNIDERASDHVRQALEKRCPEVAHRYNILNVAMPGASSVHEEALLSDLLEKGVSIKHVFAMISSNDHFANVIDEKNGYIDITQRRSKGIVRWLKENRYRSRLVQFVLPRLVQMSWFRSLYSVVKSDLGLGEFIAMRAMYVDNELALKQVAATERSLTRMKEVAPLSIALVPDRYRFDAKLEDTALRGLSEGLGSGQTVMLERESVLMKTVADRLQVEFVDPNDMFRAQGAGHLLSYPVNGHLTPLGHSLLSDVLLAQSSFLQRFCSED